MKIKNLPQIAENCLICLDDISLKRNNKSAGKIVSLEDYGTHRTKLPANIALVVMIRLLITLLIDTHIWPVIFFIILLL